MSCADASDSCAAWASAGECSANPSFMRSSCALSCGTCCGDTIAGCSLLAEQELCVRHTQFMWKYCAGSCGRCQAAPPASEVCVDQELACASWAGRGDCGGVEDWCALSCATCEQSESVVTTADITLAAALPRPPIIYGTAWKGAHTGEAVVAAVRAGFRGIDTGGQPRHYDEAAVGEAIARLVDEGIAREDLWVQTKFTPEEWQDAATLPFEAGAAPEQQVAASVTASLRKLRMPHVDALILHSLDGREPATLLREWRALEAAHDAGHARWLGLSNIHSVATLARLHAAARIKPAVLQNAFWERSSFDADVRSWCAAQGVVYQGYRLMQAAGRLESWPGFSATAVVSNRTCARGEDILLRVSASAAAE